MKLPDSHYFPGDEGRIKDKDLFQYLKKLLIEHKKVYEEIARVVNANSQYFGDVAGGNYAQFENDGTLVFFGNGTVYNDIITSISSGKLPAANAPTWSVFKNNIYNYSFAVNDHIQTSAAEMPHGYEEGSVIEAHIHWATNGTDGTDRYVRWELEYTAATINSAFPTTTVISTSDIKIPAGTADRTHLYTDITDIPGAGMEIGAIGVVRLRRVASSGTAPTSNPFGLHVGFHISHNTMGSREELTK